MIKHKITMQMSMNVTTKPPLLLYMNRDVAEKEIVHYMVSPDVSEMLRIIFQLEDVMIVLD